MRSLYRFILSGLASVALVVMGFSEANAQRFRMPVAPVTPHTGYMAIPQRGEMAIPHTGNFAGSHAAYLYQSSYANARLQGNLEAGLLRNNQRYYNPALDYLLFSNIYYGRYYTPFGYYNYNPFYYPYFFPGLYGYNGWYGYNPYFYNPLAISPYNFNPYLAYSPYSYNPYLTVNYNAYPARAASYSSYAPTYYVSYDVPLMSSYSIPTSGYSMASYEPTAATSYYQGPETAANVNATNPYLAFSATTPAANRIVDVGIYDDYFDPVTYSVNVGTTVRWINHGRETQTVTSDIGLWDSGKLPPGSVNSYTFTQPGIYTYHSASHPQSMRGTIIVP